MVWIHSNIALETIAKKSLDLTFLYPKPPFKFTKNWSRFWSRNFIFLRYRICIRKYRIPYNPLILLAFHSIFPKRKIYVSYLDRVEVAGSNPVGIITFLETVKPLYIGIYGFCVFRYKYAIRHFDHIAI
jgi:hypothetical protein